MFKLIYCRIDFKQAFFLSSILKRLSFVLFYPNNRIVSLVRLYLLNFKIMEMKILY